MKAAACAAVLGTALLAACSSSLDSSHHGGGLAVAGATSSSSGFAPLVVVTSPAPGSWVAGPDVTVEGRVSGRAFASVEVAGATASLAADGTFKGTAHLADAGVQTVTVRATDVTGHDAFTHVAYVRGPFATGEVADAVELHLEPPALGPASDLLQDELRALDLEALVQSANPLTISVVKNVVSVDLVFGQATYAPPKATIGFGQGTLDVAAEIDDIVLDATVDDRSNLVPIKIAVTAKARSAKATAQARLSVPPGGGVPVCTLSTPVVALDGLTIDAKSAIPNLLVSLLSKKIEALLESELAGVVARKVPPIIDKELALLAAPQNVALNGAALDLSLRALRADVTPAGCIFALAADVAPSTTAVRGQWVTRGSLPVAFGGPAKAVKLALAQDVFSNALTGLWRSGALDLDLKASSGNAGLPLDGDSIGKLVPELAAFVSPTTPIVVKVRPLCPPELRLGAASQPYRVVLGEVRIEIDADRGNGALDPLLVVALHADVPVTATATGNTLSVTPGPQRAMFLFAVREQPKVRVDEERVAVRLTVLADAELSKAFAPLGTLTLPTVLGKQVQDADLAVPTPGFDHLLVGASLR